MKISELRMIRTDIVVIKLLIKNTFHVIPNRSDPRAFLRKRKSNPKSMKLVSVISINIETKYWRNPRIKKKNHSRGNFLRYFRVSSRFEAIDTPRIRSNDPKKR